MATILRQARRIPVECYPILGVVAFSLSCGVRVSSLLLALLVAVLTNPSLALALALALSQAYISTHTLRDTLDVSLHPRSNPRPWTSVSPDTPPPATGFVPKSERMA